MSNEGVLAGPQDFAQVNGFIEMKTEIVMKRDLLESFVTNCHLEPRDGQADMIYVTAEGHHLARLDGYAIVPKEKYEELLAKQSR